MQCSSCGGNHSSNHCRQSAPVATTAVALAPQDLKSDQTNSEKLDAEVEGFSSETRSVSRLIEFPGVTRRAVPQWRKELSERVREVQERRIREAAAEAEEAERMEKEKPTTSAPQLELLPQAEMPQVNPVVAAALRRIERAYEEPLASGYSRVATAAAVVPDDDVETAFAEAVAPPEEEVISPSEPPTVAERTHNLVIVQAAAAPDSETSYQKPKPKRLIVDDANDPALSYLDSIALVGGLSATVEDRAPLFRRIMAAVIDALTVGFLCLPFAAVIELQNGNWHRPRIVGLMVGIAAVVMFVYATVSTALTGRTFGMRLLSLRAIDVRTGLIPTGKQSAGRALIYLLSLATMGIGLLLAFARGEGKTTHDRLSRTAVVRD